MLLFIDQNKLGLSGVHNIISNTNKTICINNKFSNTSTNQSLFINNNLILNQNKTSENHIYKNYSVVYNTQTNTDIYIENNKSTNSITNFPCISIHPNFIFDAGGGYYDYNINLANIALQTDKNFIYGSNLIATNNGLKWQAITSYSKVLKSGDVILSKYDKVLPYIQANNSHLQFDINYLNQRKLYLTLNSYYANITVTSLFNNINIDIDIINFKSSNCIFNLQLNKNVTIQAIPNLELINSTFNFTTMLVTSNEITKIKNSVIRYNFIDNSTTIKLFKNTNNYGNIITILRDGLSKNIDNLIIIPQKDSQNYPPNSFIPQTVSGILFVSPNYCPENGNEIVLSTITTQYANKQNNIIKYSIDNSVLYTLGAHAHAIKLENNEKIKEKCEDYTKEENGIFFPINIAGGNITHVKTSNDNYKEYLSGKTTYLSANKNINLTFIPENTLLPVGGIAGWMQYYNGSEWIPKVPYGFYALSPEIQYINIDCDNPKGHFYNAELAKAQNAVNTITLPAGQVITNQNGSSRIIKILKYSDHWTYHDPIK